MPLDDQTRLRHMRDSAEEAIQYVGGKSSDEFAADRLHSQAVVRCIEVIGEAAVGVSDELKASSPEIPWRDLIAMRNRLIHGYFDIDTKIVWETVNTDLPALLEQIRALINDNPS